MFIVDAELLPLYDALDIAAGYLVRSGYGLSEANEARVFFTLYASLTRVNIAP